MIIKYINKKEQKLDLKGIDINGKKWYKILRWNACVMFPIVDIIYV